MRLSVVIPAYNEKDRVLELLRRVDAVSLSLEKEIIVSEGKKIGWKDGLAALWHILRYRFLG